MLPFAEKRNITEESSLNTLPDRPGITLRFGDTPEHLDNEDLYEAIVWRRIVAFFIDWIIIGMILLSLGILTFFTLGLIPFYALTPVIPIAYHSWLIGSDRSATFGMQMMGIEVRGVDGERPGFFQAFVMTAIFYLSVTFTGSLILIVALFTDRNRCLHDFLSGTIVVNTLYLNEDETE